LAAGGRCCLWLSFRGGRCRVVVAAIVVCLVVVAAILLSARSWARGGGGMGGGRGSRRSVKTRFCVHTSASSSTDKRKRKAYRRT